MGCDIHLMVEVRTEAGWRYAHSPAHLAKMTEDCPDGMDPATWAASQNSVYRLGGERREGFDHKFGQRDYRVFGVLAGVRRRMPEVTPIIAQPRGMPEDADPETLAQVWEADDHSHSWVTDDELWRRRSDLSDSYVDLAQLLHECPLPTRLVFFFDN